MVRALGGPGDILKNPLIHFTPPPIVQEIPANNSGYLPGMDVRDIGLSLVSLKAGRVKSSATIDHSIGLSDVVQIGQYVSLGDPLAIAQVRNLNDIDFLKKELSQAINITD
jgi:thymidine phosphorylase